MSDSGSKIDFSMVIASAVHDMKNSLGMLLHSLDELRQDLPDEVQQTQRFNTLQYEAERVHGDLVQLLGLYRLGEQGLSAHIDELFVPDFLEEQMARHLALLQGLGLNAEVKCDALTGYFDPELVAGVINNTLNNAIRYTRSRIRFSAWQEDGYLILAVEDDGQGYPPHMLDAPLSMERGIDFASGSTNLGLFFASQVAQMHQEGERQGQIRLRNGGELGGGIFELYLP